jgi:ferric-dicitrate binding protein FerR (iron transport regulator)
MKLVFPSHEFDNAVAAVCHGAAGDEQMLALNELLRANPAARDEYVLMVELHSRLASEPGLFSVAEPTGPTEEPVPVSPGEVIRIPLPRPSPARSRVRRAAWVLALAACLALLAALGLALRPRHSGTNETTSTAVAVLACSVDAQWSQPSELHPVGAALEPGWLRLKSGLAQVVFYSGARVVMEGPAELRLVSPREAFCQDGLASAEVPPQARGFSISTPKMSVVDLGTEFGLDVKSSGVELHVFKGGVDFRAGTATSHNLVAGEAAAVDDGGTIRSIPVNSSLFARAFDLQQKSLAVQDVRYQQWRAANARLNLDPSLLVHFDFESSAPSTWMLHNVASQNASVPDATIVGGQWTEGRWPQKHALEFRSISDRVRLDVPGEFEAVTYSAWVNVGGLDRPFNSLFMADGFDPGKIHWQIQNGGVLDLGIQGPRIEDCQIFTSPAVVGFDQFGRWMHLAVVVDGKRKQVTHYVNGVAVSRHPLKLEPPFRIGDAELGNWNPGRFSRTTPYFIRHFSGVMDEFMLFSRALSDEEISRLYSEGNPQIEPDAASMESVSRKTSQAPR